MIAIIDYGAGNLMSVENCLNVLGVESIITSDIEAMLKCGGVILPGVGEFGDAMKNLELKKLKDGIREINTRGLPFLGICLGQQLLFNSSEESVGVCGLGIFDGEVVKLKAGNMKVPHMCWSSLDFKKKSRLFGGIEDNEFFYFVHSYCVEAADKEIVSATCKYGQSFDAVVEKDNMFAVQFHPEKSSTAGLKLMANFLRVAGENPIEVRV